LEFAKTQVELKGHVWLRYRAMSAGVRAVLKLHL